MGQAEYLVSILIQAEYLDLLINIPVSFIFLSVHCVASGTDESDICSSPTTDSTPAMTRSWDSKVVFSLISTAATPNAYEVFLHVHSLKQQGPTRKGHQIPSPLCGVSSFFW